MKRGQHVTEEVKVKLRWAAYTKLESTPDTQRWGQAYRNQKMDAQLRGIPFLLTFSQWLGNLLGR